MRSSVAFELLEAERRERVEMRLAFEAEREQWAEERRMLLNAALSGTQSEFVVRQQAAKPPAPARPQPITEVPAEAHEGRPRALGI